MRQDFRACFLLSSTNITGDLSWFGRLLVCQAGGSFWKQLSELRSHLQHDNINEDIWPATEDCLTQLTLAGGIVIPVHVNAGFAKCVSTLN